MAVELSDDERREVRRKAHDAVLTTLRGMGGEGLRHEIIERSRSRFTARELAALPPDKGRAKYRSLVDHQLSWALTDLKRDGHLENPRWSVWRLADASERKPESAVVSRPSLARLRELRAMPAAVYRRTPEWQRTRRAALAHPP